ncbi:hypothetical protein [Alkalimarinus coralli]|uniref:hypothetical protein n=1 Tax=Alkalimarinus coralli TaxID=2935863 RepID=UPI00202B736B|nr:hypothetical protein [Alkalimarinus coralli]
MKPDFLRSTCAIVALILLWVPHVEAAYWGSLRDGVLHVSQQQSKERSIPVSWKGTNIADAQNETLYWSSPKGMLLQRVAIPFSQPSGGTNLTIPAVKGDYRLDIPGYSFRKYVVNVPNTLPSVFEPAKLHFSAEVPNTVKLYFQVPANKRFILAGKDHGGVDRLEIVNLTSHEEKVLSLKDYGQLYSSYDQVEVAASPEASIWQLTLKGGGKAAFWLDHIPNLFALDPKELFVPTLEEGQVDISIEGVVAGDMPKIGAALDFSRPPASADAIFDKLKLGSANYYFYEDILSSDIAKDNSFLEYYEQKLGLDNYISILAKTGRRSTISDADDTADFLTRYLKSHRGENGFSFPYLAIADEPNLNYGSYNQFEKDFVAIASTLKNHPEPSVSSIQMAVPQSSRFVNGPTRSDSDERIGADWAERLLQGHPDLVDSISWHQWLVRDLVATEQYKSTVLKARELDRQYPAKSGLPRPLILAQTNISSGNNLSHYEQNTFFAGLWLASVVANASSSGQLSQLNWFKIADDGVWNKGLIAIEGAQFKLKPVAHIMAMINEMWLPKVMDVKFSQPSVEFELLPTSRPDTGEVNMLGVNKSKRQYVAKISVNCKLLSCDGEPSGTLRTIDQSLAVRTQPLASVVIENQRVYELSITPETVFYLNFNVNSGPLAPKITVSRNDR